MTAKQEIFSDLWAARVQALIQSLAHFVDPKHFFGKPAFLLAWGRVFLLCKFVIIFNVMSNLSPWQVATYFWGSKKVFSVCKISFVLEFQFFDLAGSRRILGSGEGATSVPISSSIAPISLKVDP